MPDETLIGGTTVSYYIKAEDKAGNTKTITVNDIKVYDIPSIDLTQPSNGYSISATGSLTELFTVTDSFGETISARITTSDSIIPGEFITVNVYAIDVVGNVVDRDFEIAVLSDTQPFVELYVEGVLWKSIYIDDSNEYILPVPEDWGLPFICWQNDKNVAYTDESGKGLLALDDYNMLFAYSEYAPVRTIEDLQNISTNLSKKYMLLNDLDLKGISWEPIGTQSTKFSGEFDGNGHTISNLKVSGQKLYGALFGYSNGIIKNLAIKNVTVNCSPKSGYSYGYAAGIVAYMSGGRVENCSVAGSIYFSGTSGYAGGIVADLISGTITNCVVTASVEARGSNQAYAGGIAARVQAGVIETCSVEQTVKATISWPDTFNYAYAGGIVGYINNNTSTIVSVEINQCVSNAYVTAFRSSGSVTCYAGGIIGYANVSSGNPSRYIEVNECISSGDVVINSGESNVYAGGIIGYSNNGDIYNSYSTSLVDAKASYSQYTSPSLYVGGLVGYNTGTIYNSYATGTVKGSIAKKCYVGGLIGYNTGTVSKCVAINTLFVTLNEDDHTYEIGGVVGSNTGKITTCYRYSGQVFNITVADTKLSTPTNTLGTSQSLERLKAASFYTSTLGWDEDIWSFVDGEYPALNGIDTLVVG